jgi:hydrogenase 3 maturation protease
MKYLLLGVGNRMRGDDGAGSILTDSLAKLNSNWIVIDGGIAPENYTSEIKKHNPDKVFIADACEINEKAGSFCFVDLEDISEDYSFNSHSIPLTLLIGYIKTFVKEVFFIGIQPKKLELSEELSNEVNNGIKELAIILSKRQFHKIKFKNDPNRNTS